MEIDEGNNPQGNHNNRRYNPINTNDNIDLNSDEETDDDSEQDSEVGYDHYDERGAFPPLKVMILHFLRLSSFGFLIFSLVLVYFRYYARNIKSDDVSHNNIKKSYPIRHGIDEEKAIDKIQPFNIENTNKLKNALDILKFKMKYIEKTWQVTKYPAFLETMHLPTQSFDIQVNKFILKFIDDVPGKSERTTPFVFGISGSSVTAGHDNYYNQSYPAILESTLKPVFTALSIPLEVRNGAMGNNPCMPYDICMPAIMGTDVDVLGWEQSMFCGHDSRPVEAFTRAAYSMKKLPTILYMAAGTPVWKPEECNATNFDAVKEASVFADINSGSKGVRENILRDGIHSFATLRSVLNNNTLLQDFTFLQGHKGGNGGTLEQQSTFQTLPELYSHLPVMAQSVLSVGRYKCMGPYGNEFIKQADSRGHMWHPGVKGHQMRAHSIAYAFLGTMGVALEGMLTAMKVKKGGGKTTNNAVRNSKIWLQSQEKQQLQQKQGMKMESRRLFESNKEKIETKTNKNIESETKEGRKKDVFLPAVRPSASLPNSRSSGSSSSGKGKESNRNQHNKRPSPGGGSRVGIGGGTPINLSKARRTLTPTQLGLLTIYEAALKKREKWGIAPPSSSSTNSDKHRSPSAFPYLSLLPTTTVSCDPFICLNDQIHCATDYLPRHGADMASYVTYKSRHIEDPMLGGESHLHAQLRSYLLKRAQNISAATTTNTTTTTTTTTTTAATSYLGRLQQDFLRSLITPNGLQQRYYGNSNWELQLSFFDARAVAKGEAKGMGYQDRKMVWVSPANVTSGNERDEASLTILVSVGELNAKQYGGRVWLCELQKGFLQYPADYGDLDKDANLESRMLPRLDKIIESIDNGNGVSDSSDGSKSPMHLPNLTAIIDIENRQHDAIKYSLKLSQGATTRGMDYCYETTGLPAGQHLLTLWPKNATKRLTLAYVVTWAETEVGSLL